VTPMPTVHLRPLCVGQEGITSVDAAVTAIALEGLSVRRPGVFLAAGMTLHVLVVMLSVTSPPMITASGAMIQSVPQVVLQTLTAHRTALSAGVLAQEAKWGTPTDVDVILTLTVMCLKSVKMTSVLKDAGPTKHVLGGMLIAWELTHALTARASGAQKAVPMTPTARALTPSATPLTTPTVTSASAITAHSAVLATVTAQRTTLSVEAVGQVPVDAVPTQIALVMTQSATYLPMTTASGVQGLSAE